MEADHKSKKQEYLLAIALWVFAISMIYIVVVKLKTILNLLK